MTEESEGYQANPCEGGTQGREGDMGREIQANGDKGKAGGPKHYDRQKAQGGIDGHCLSARLRPLAEIWQVYLIVFWPIIAVLVQVSAEAA
jgi:hypothetical protein